jgi:LacI family transcriptional regulator
MPDRPRICLLVESSREYGRGLLRGIAAYARVHGPWLLYHLERALGDPAPPRLEDWASDGIIARIESRHLLREIRRLGLPTVDLLGLYDVRGIPVVRPDDAHTTRLGFEHLAERGLRRFAYCGFSGIYYSDLRQGHFVRRVTAAGFEPHIYVGARPPRGTHISTIEQESLRRMQELADWVRELPRPIGIMTCNDLRAQQVLNVCGVLGIAVPDEVAVLGVDNDEVVCELCTPPLSSVRLNTHVIGYEAASVLHHMLTGKTPPVQRVLIESPGVVTRQSTEVLLVNDPPIATAVRLIRERACQGISVADVFTHVKISHSTLVRRFTQLVGRSPKAEIDRVRIERVKELLSATGLPLVEIAPLAGFNHVEILCKLFKAKTGRTPGQYRKQVRI